MDLKMPFLQAALTGSGTERCKPQDARASADRACRDGERAEITGQLELFGVGNGQLSEEELLERQRVVRERLSWLDARYPPARDTDTAEPAEELRRVRLSDGRSVLVDADDEHDDQQFRDAVEEQP